MKLILSILPFCFITSVLNSQTLDSNYDLRLGIGSSFLGTGDVLAGMLESEVNYKISNTFSTSGGLALGRSDYNKDGAATFFQLNANFYLSMFPRMRKNDFRIGTGISYYFIRDAATITVFQLADQREQISFGFENRNSPGLNVIIEHTYLISKELLIGAKVFVQPYANGDVNSGILLKCGFMI